MASTKKLTYIIDLLKGGGDGAKKAVGELEQLNKTSKKTEATLDDVKAAATGLFAGAAVVAFIREIAQADRQMQALEQRFKAGSGKAAAADFRFVREESKRLGLDLQAAANGFTSLSAAARGTKLEGNGVKEVYLGIAEGGTVLNLRGDQVTGAMRAVELIMSMGGVSAEELRQQLGERLPGAFQIAARAMGVTTAELDKMLSLGQLASEDFLPRFAHQLRTEFGAQVAEASQTSTANLNRLKTSLLELKVAIAKGGIGQDLDSLVQQLTKLATWLAENRAAAGAISTGLETAAVAAGAFATAIAGIQVGKLASVSASFVGLSKLRFAGVIGGLTSILIVIKAINEASKAGAAADTLNAAEAAAQGAAENRVPRLLKALEAAEKDGSLPADQIALFRESLKRGGAGLSTRQTIISDALIANNPAARPGDEPDDPAALKRFKEIQKEVNERLFDPADRKRLKIREEIAAFEEEIRSIQQVASISTREVGNLFKDLNALVRLEDHRAKEQREREARGKERETRRENLRFAKEELELLERRLELENLADNKLPGERISADEFAREGRIRQLQANGVLHGEDAASLLRQSAEQAAGQRAALAAEGAAILNELELAALPPGIRDAVETQEHFILLEDQLRAFFDASRDLAQGNADELTAIKEREVAAFRELEKEKGRAMSENFQLMREVGGAAARQFSAGMANAFVAFASGTKSAADAFKSFAADFLRSIAQMILQQLIFNAIKNSSLGGALGLADGGVRFAANGLVSTGVGGVGMTSGAVFAARHNVIAGEAGPEALTVLSQPRTVMVNGSPVMLGKAQGADLALMSQANLAGMFPAAPRMAAAGMVTSSGTMGAGGLKSGGGNGAGVLTVRLEPGLRAEWTEEAVGAATAATIEQMGAHGAMNDAVRGAVS